MNKIIIDWSHSPTYTTIMAIFAGSSLISVSNVGRKLLKKQLNSTGWAINLAALGMLLLITGANMALTWPLKGLPFDNIVFGETSFALGILDIALAFYLWKRRMSLEQLDFPLYTIGKELAPFKTVLTGLGLGIIAIAYAAIQYRFFIAPRQEPIGGDFALKYPNIENVGIASMFFCVGVAALLTVLFLSDFSKDSATVKWYHKANYILLQITGWLFIFCGVVVFYTHIGLINNTMK